MKSEIECRLLEVNVEEFLSKLKKTNATLVGDWIQIRNCYDFTPVKDNSWIRLRTNGVETTLTIKEINNSNIDGTKESEIIVSDFDQANEILNKLGYNVRSHQENRRIRYMLDGVEIDIDFWPMIPAYVEFEGESEDAIKSVCTKLDVDFNTLTTLDVEKVYKKYGIDITKLRSSVELEESIKTKKYDL